MKKALSVWLSLLLLLMLAVPALAADDPYFSIDKDGVLLAYRGPGGDVVIPESVRRIGEGAFLDCTSLTGVVIGDNVTYIGKSAFRGCTALTALAVPDSVTGVGTAAFADCTALTYAAGFAGAGFIGDRAFAGCTALEYFTIDEGALDQHIGDNCFSGCEALREITIPRSVVSVGDNAFLGCAALTDVWYGGGAADWAAVKIDPEGNDALAAAAIYFLGDMVPAMAETIEFADVAEDAYYAVAVDWAVAAGVTNGTKLNDENGLNWFSPDATVKRGDAVTFLWRRYGCPEPETEENRFQDLTKDYYKKAILWAVEKGVTNGTRWDEAQDVYEFSPDAPVTRGQMLTFLWRAEGKPGYTGDGLGGYADAEYWAHEVGILGDNAGSYTTAAACPRSDVVYYLFNAILLG